MGIKESILKKENKAGLWYVGQAGFIVQSKNGRCLAIDLYLSDCVETLEGHIGYKRLIPKILMPEEIEFDVIVATHPHQDHFDYGSMGQLMKNTSSRLFASTECERYVNELKIDSERVDYIKPGDVKRVEDFLIEFVPCDHGAGAPDAVGVIISFDGFKIYMAGDTCLRMDWAEKMREKGPFDIIIGPINGAYGNMNETEFAEYSMKIGAELIIPCHYGMFADHGGNPGKFLEEMKRIGGKEKCFLMTPGEGIELRRMANGI